MRIDVGNMLRQAGNAAGDRYGYRWALSTLSENLKDLRDRTSAGDMKSLDEFFKLYVFDDGADYEDKKNSKGMHPNCVPPCAACDAEPSTQTTFL